MFRADLHCHSTCSDGSNSPQELVDLAIKSGLQGLSITDHDTSAAYPAALSYAKEKGLLMGTGIELSCTHEEISVHVLGYGFTPGDESLFAFCAKHEARRKERNRAILRNLERFSIPIREEELPSARTVGRPHIAELMMKKGYVGSLQEAFQKYLGEGKCCYEKGQVVSLDETLSVLHKAKAKAFLAHPHLFPKSSFVRKILELPFDGIECYYARCPPYQERRFLEMAKDRNLLISGGSDFHGSYKPNLSLGSRFVDEAAFNAIFNH